MHKQKQNDQNFISEIIEKNSSKEFDLKLPNYVGITKEFIARTNSQSTSGAVFLYLYKPNGQLASNDWILGVNETAVWKFTLPTSGIWRVKVVAQLTNEPILFSAKWN